MVSPYDLVVLAATIGSGLVAGLCFAFATFIMRAFDDLEARQAIRAMQAINARILRSAAMVVWWGTAVIGIAAAILGGGEGSLPVAAAALYGLGALLITGRRNVPLNEELARIDPDAPEAGRAWIRYRVRWSRWNALRTVACALACAGFALAA